MSDINPNNYPGATVTVVGNAVGPAETRAFPNGGSVTEVTIAVNTGYKKGDEFIQTGTNYYTVSATPDWASSNWPATEKGDRLRIDEARQEVREYVKKDGTTGYSIELRFGTLVNLGRSAGGGDKAPANTPF